MKILVILLGAVIFLMLMALSLIQFILSEIELTSDSQLTFLESGFEALFSGLILSSSFFLLAVLFVLFDVELILLAPMVLFSLKMTLVKQLMFVCLLAVVLGTLILEWLWCGLKWNL